MQAVIMAGGKGTRLGVLTRDIPKPMVPINGKPILLHQIENLRENGILDIILVVGHLGQRIRDYFGDGERLGVRIGYVTEEHPLGTAGNFYYLRDRVREDFILLYGDILLDIDYSRFVRFHREKGAFVSLFAHPNSHPFDSDLVEADGDDRIVNYLPKNMPRADYRNLVNAGVYVCQPDVLSFVERPEKLDFEKDLLFSRMLSRGVYAYRSPEYVKDAGTPERLDKVARNERDGIVRQKNLKNDQKCIFLDRDGTVNVFKGLIAHPDEIELEKDVDEAIRRINDSAYLCILITNQPVVARGMCTVEELERIHCRLEMLLGERGAYLDDIVYCPHHPDRGYEGERVEYKIACSCRKPKTGLIDACVERYHIDRSRSFMIGDTTIDVQTGINAGLQTVLLRTGEAGRDRKFNVRPDRICTTLLEAVREILGDAR